MATIRNTTSPVDTALPFPPATYDPQFVNRVVQVLRQFMQTANKNMANPTFINVYGMPLNGNLQPVGTVYIDADALRVVVLGALYAPAFSITASMGTVSWTVT